MRSRLLCYAAAMRPWGLLLLVLGSLDPGGYRKLSILGYRSTKASAQRELSIGCGHGYGSERQWDGANFADFVVLYGLQGFQWFYISLDYLTVMLLY